MEIRRFKSDPSCRLFLSSDSGSVGLNLQVASAVVNMDLPWNPAKLEQRIARAWRKFQTKVVTVINLVCEDSIEHSILHLLGRKQGLADGVLDGRGDLASLKMPSGRAALIDRMAALLAPTYVVQLPVIGPARRFAAATIEHFGDAVLLIERRRRDDGADTLIAVLDRLSGKMADAKRRLTEAALASGIAAVEFMDRAGWEAIRRLAAGGVVRFADADEVLHRSGVLDETPQSAEQAARARNRQAAVDWLNQAERKLRMSALLADGGFGFEALAPIGEAASLALRGLAIIVDADLEPEAVKGLSETELTELEAIRPHLPPGTIAYLASIGSGADSERDLSSSRVAAQSLLSAARAEAERAMAS